MVARLELAPGNSRLLRRLTLGLPLLLAAVALGALPEVGALALSPCLAALLLRQRLQYLDPSGLRLCRSSAGWLCQWRGEREPVPCVLRCRARFRSLLWLDVAFDSGSDHSRGACGLRRPRPLLLCSDALTPADYRRLRRRLTLDGVM